MSASRTSGNPMSRRYRVAPEVRRRRPDRVLGLGTGAGSLGAQPRVLTPARSSPSPAATTFYLHCSPRRGSQAEHALRSQQLPLKRRRLITSSCWAAGWPAPRARASERASEHAARAAACQGGCGLRVAAVPVPRTCPPALSEWGAALLSVCLAVAPGAHVRVVSIVKGEAACPHLQLPSPGGPVVCVVPPQGTDAWQAGAASERMTNLISCCLSLTPHGMRNDKHSKPSSFFCFNLEISSGSGL
ncbi:uncharacterized protein [Oryctolagus cuniculus]|uniref:uncharacterized protein n=1 Tax=Oryctolagus cuniculus TaxID=9986 RepID=UPI00387A2E21